MRVHPSLTQATRKQDLPNKKGGGAPTGAPSIGRINGCGSGLFLFSLPRLRGRIGRGPARLSALHRGSPRGAFLRGDSVQAALHATGGCGSYPHHRQRLSEAPRAPVVMPAGTMPGPPGSGVTSPARGNRTRSVNRPSPVTSLMSEILRRYSNSRSMSKDSFADRIYADKSRCYAARACAGSKVARPVTTGKDSLIRPQRRYRWLPTPQSRLRYRARPFGGHGCTGTTSLVTLVQSQASNGNEIRQEHL